MGVRLIQSLPLSCLILAGVFTNRSKTEWLSTFVSVIIVTNNVKLCKVAAEVTDQLII